MSENPSATIKEAQVAKRFLEEQIALAIREFERVSGMQAQSLQLVRVPIVGGGPQHLAVAVEVTLP